MTQIVVPTLGESVAEATVAQWLKREGDPVKADEPIVELETDKVTLEVNAPSDGVIVKISVGEGDSVEVGAILGEMEEGAVANDTAKPAKKEEKAASAPKGEKKEAPKAAPSQDVKTSPAVRKLINDNNLNAAQIPASGKDGRLSKQDVEDYLKSAKGGSSAAPSPAPAASAPAAPRETGPREERVKMTKLRQVIARRLKEAQNTAAMLTTFNEVDMGPVMDLRNEYKDIFEKRHGVKLGFMSFFIKATIQALKEFPAINAEIDGEDIIYKNYYNIGVAVSTPQGLVVPVLKDVDQMSMAEIEAKIVDFGKRARDGKLGMDEMTGGTYTITNGGVFGSLMSTPILNTPQSGILGMHTIQKRPMVGKNGEIEVKPMMYLAQSYDHRIVDGREAVSSLVRIKQAIEDPQRLLLDV
ncbi:MAG: 2-oxoglutarate dehydrogenase complex dihydrolipoyllysine-residue succinyltransferase [Alphaproteobacteria bacterium]|nr:2-oxoglutarate dehydrogenase complex dihydrolipoyllysine-residue succinyltransferase [Alphaproteobacteria bacterium]